MSKKINPRMIDGGILILETLSDKPGFENKFPYCVSCSEYFDDDFVDHPTEIIGSIIRDEDGIWFDPRSSLISADALHQIAHFIIDLLETEKWHDIALRMAEDKGGDCCRCKDDCGAKTRHERENTDA